MCVRTSRHGVGGLCQGQPRHTEQKYAICTQWTGACRASLKVIRKPCSPCVESEKKQILKSRTRWRLEFCHTSLTCEPARTFKELWKRFCLIKKVFSRSAVSDPSCCDNDTAAEAERTPLPQITGPPLTQSFLPSAGAKSQGRASAAPPPGPRPHKSRKRQPWPLALWQTSLNHVSFYPPRFTRGFSRGNDKHNNST